MAPEVRVRVKRTSAAVAPEPRVSDEAIMAKTGRSWLEWFAALDRVGAKGRTQPEIVTLMSQRFGVGAWWRQLISIEYGRAQDHRAAKLRTGWSATVSRTFDVPHSKLVASFENARSRAMWMRVKEAAVRSGTPGRVLRFDWPDGSRVEARFTPVGSAKSEVAIEQTRLTDAEAVKGAKSSWDEALERLSARLEG